MRQKRSLKERKRKGEEKMDEDLIKELFGEESGEAEPAENEEAAPERDELKAKLYDMGLRMDAAEFIAGLAKGMDAAALYEGAKGFASRPGNGVKMEKDEDDMALRRAFGL